jgi:hypothetical protein
VVPAERHRHHLAPAQPRPWSTVPLRDLALGDFDGDGLTDVFSADGTAWRYHPGGRGAITLSAPNDLRVGKLRFADLSGDGRTDVFYGNGRRWRYKDGGAGAWIELAIASEESAQVWLANFDGNRRADVFFPGCR